MADCRRIRHNKNPPDPAWSWGRVVSHRSAPAERNRAHMPEVACDEYWRRGAAPQPGAWHINYSRVRGATGTIVLATRIYPCAYLIRLTPLLTHSAARRLHPHPPHQRTHSHSADQPKLSKASGNSCRCAAPSSACRNAACPHHRVAAAALRNDGSPPGLAGAQCDAGLLWK